MPDSHDTAPTSHPTKPRTGAALTYDAVIVGAGFAGMMMLHRLRGLGLTARVFETGDGVGGTWYWNRYPGARCDVESMQYSYQFSEDLQQDWSWSEKFAAQPEILTYAEHVADRYDLRRDIQLESRVNAAHWDEATDTWTTAIDHDGRTERVRSRFLILCVGCLSAANKPSFPGFEVFKGPHYHTGYWPHEPVDFTGKRVGIIGTGSSGIQTIPHVAEQAEHLTVFQRTPNYVVPDWNRPLDPDYEAAIKADYAGLREKAKTRPSGIWMPFNTDSALDVSAEERERRFEEFWNYGGLGFMGCFGDLLTNEASNTLAADFVRGKIREIVTDPEVAAKLTPDNIIGCKRLCVHSTYYETFNRDDITLVDLRTEGSIERFTEGGLVVGGVEHPLDAVIFATGFDAMTGSFEKIAISGVEGQTLTDKWEAGPRTYLGVQSAGFPNMFMVTGPGSPSVLSNVLVSIEQNVEWITECLDTLVGSGKHRIEPEVEAEDAWVEEVNRAARGSLRSTCSSWYNGANIPGKPLIFIPYIGGIPDYTQACEASAANGYAGFKMR
jgi:cyclohexanone monooxygenase